MLKPLKPGTSRASGRTFAIVAAKYNGRYVDAMLRGIVGFRFAVARLEGKLKMSQNRENQDRAGVVKGLGLRADGDDLEIADIVTRQLTPRD